MNVKQWTVREERAVMDEFKRNGAHVASEASGRSVQAIRTRASELGISRKISLHRDGLTARVLAMLSEGPVCAYDVVLEHGCRRSAASMCLSRLARSGRAERFGGMSNRMYRLTPCNC